MHRVADGLKPSSICKNAIAWLIDQAFQTLPAYWLSFFPGFNTFAFDIESSTRELRRFTKHCSPRQGVSGPVSLVFNMYKESSKGPFPIPLLLAPPQTIETKRVPAPPRPSGPGTFVSMKQQAGVSLGPMVQTMYSLTGYPEADGKFREPIEEAIKKAEARGIDRKLRKEVLKVAEPSEYRVSDPSSEVWIR